MTDYQQRLEERTCRLEEELVDRDNKIEKLFTELGQYRLTDTNPAFVDHCQDMVGDTFGVAPKLHILNYYPFGKDCEYPIMGNTFVLTDILNSAHKYGMRVKEYSDLQLITEISIEINRAMEYLFFLRTDVSGWRQQRINAVAYCNLISNGIRYRRKVKFEELEQKAQEWLDEFNKKHNPNLTRTFQDAIGYINTYGVEEVCAKPIYEQRHDDQGEKVITINYSHEELLAIHFMITQGEFENLC